MKSSWSAVALVVLLLTACQPGTGNALVTSAKIGDYAWMDENRNGIQDEGEGPFPDLEVRLYGSDRTALLETTMTDSQGAYSFSLQPGSYQLKFEQPSDYSFTQKDAQQNERDAEDSDVFPSGNDQGWTELFTVESGLNYSGWDAGYFTESVAPTPTPTPVGVITSPTGIPVTPTPANPSGEHQVQVVVKFDDAGHVTFVALADADGNTIVLIDLTDAGVEMGFNGTNPQNTSVTLFGSMDVDGRIVADGSGVVAGFQNVSGNFTGTITVDDSGAVHINGELTLGGNSELPQGLPIIYTISS